MSDVLNKAREKLKKYQLRKQRDENAKHDKNEIENSEFLAERDDVDGVPPGGAMAMTMAMSVALAAEVGVDQQQMVQQYTAWEYQEYIDSILLELDMVKAQLNTLQESTLAQSSDVPGVGLGLGLGLGLGGGIPSNELLQQLDAANLEISRLQTEHDQSSDLLAKTQYKCRGLQQENHTLQQRSSLLEDELARFQQEKSSMTTQIMQLEKEVAHQMDTSSALKKQVSVLSAGEESRASLKTELEGSRDEIKGLLVHVDTLKSAQAHQTQINRNLTAQVSLLEKESDTQAIDLENARLELADVREKHDTSLGKVAVLERANLDLEMKLVGLQAELKALKLQSTATADEKAKSGDVKSDSDARKNSNTGSVSAMSAQIIHITERCQCLQDENAGLMATLDELRTRNIALTDEKLVITEKLSAVESKYMRLVSNPTSSDDPALKSSPIELDTTSLHPTPYPNPNTTTKVRRSSDARASSSPRESDLLTQISTLTAKLLNLDVENKRLSDQLAQIQAQKLPDTIVFLESQNGKLKNALEKECKVTVLLQAEVDALPDMIEKYHEERKALLHRINREALDRSISEKDVDVAVAQTTQGTDKRMITCGKCAHSPIVYI